MGAKVVIMATAHSRQQLHRNLLHSKGDHVFEKVIEIVPPSLAERKAILKAMLSARDARNRLSEADFRFVCVIYILSLNQFGCMCTCMLRP